MRNDPTGGDARRWLKINDADGKEMQLSEPRGEEMIKQFSVSTSPLRLSSSVVKDSYLSVYLPITTTTTTTVLAGLDTE